MYIDRGVIMNRIYDVCNTAKVGYYCAAPDESEAKKIAIANGHGKSIKTLA